LLLIQKTAIPVLDDMFWSGLIAFLARVLFSSRFLSVSWATRLAPMVLPFDYYNHCPWLPIQWLFMAWLSLDCQLVHWLNYMAVMYHWIIYISLLVTVQLDDTYKLLINNVCNIYKW
jgi:hypothetical protein